MHWFQIGKGVHQGCILSPCLFNLHAKFLMLRCSVVSDSLLSNGLQHTRLPCPSPSPRACSNWCPLSQWCYQPSHPQSSPSPPAFNLSQYQDLFQWVSSSHQVAKVLELQLQHQSFQWISCEMSAWMKHKLELRLPGEISITSDMQMTSP